jgi:hypothetical protein
MAININGKKGGVALKSGGVGMVTDFALSVQGLTTSTGQAVNVSIVMKSTKTAAEWNATEKGRYAHNGRHLLVVTATQTKTRASGKEAAGDTDEISVQITNAASAADADSAPLDVVFI